MKKFFLIIFFAPSLFAGKNFTNEKRIYELAADFLRIRTQLGYGLPAEEEIWDIELTYSQKMKFFGEFNALLYEFQWHKEQFKDHFKDTEAKRNFFENFCDSLMSDKIRYENGISREWLWSEYNETTSETTITSNTVSDDAPDLILITDKSD
jgi:hypothetical protein